MWLGVKYWDGSSARAKNLSSQQLSSAHQYRRFITEIFIWTTHLLLLQKSWTSPSTSVLTGSYPRGWHIEYHNISPRYIEMPMLDLFPSTFASGRNVNVEYVGRHLIARCDGSQRIPSSFPLGKRLCHSLPTVRKPLTVSSLLWKNS